MREQGMIHPAAEEHGEGEVEVEVDSQVVVAVAVAVPPPSTHDCLLVFKNYHRRTILSMAHSAAVADLIVHDLGQWGGTTLQEHQSPRMTRRLSQSTRSVRIDSVWVS
jgi:hypothetical protein